MKTFLIFILMNSAVFYAGFRCGQERAAEPVLVPINTLEYRGWREPEAETLRAPNRDTFTI